MIRILVSLLLILGCLTMCPAEPVKQKPIARVELMPNLPQPYAMRDWQQVARDYDAFVFDFERQGQYLPLPWWDDTKVNTDRRGFGFPSYVGHTYQMETGTHESINCAGAVMAASLAGIDKSNQDGHNWVLMCQNYFNRANGQMLYGNGIGAETGNTFWYELYPNVIMYHLMWKYPDVGAFPAQMRTIAEQLYAACVVLAGDDKLEHVPNFNWTGFDFVTMQPKYNGMWMEPDAAAAVAWMEYLAWTKFGDEKYLRAAQGCLAFLERNKSNPFYEVLLPYGAYIAARANAEQGWSFDVGKLLNWCFGPSEARYGWGVIADRWGDYDCHGLVGSITDGGGYAFAMNTYTAIGALTPIARYDARYARSLGKWVLNAANAARLLYPNGLPPEKQSCWDWAEKHGAAGIVTYEGLRKKWKGTSPRAMGDPLVHNWAKTDFALYGASYVGIMAAVVHRTDQEGILQLDCCATDPFSRDAYPTYLYYNPHAEDKTVTIEVGSEPRSLYDAVSRRFLQREVAGTASFVVPSDQAVVLVVCPAGKEPVATEQGLKVNDVVIDYSTRKAQAATALLNHLQRANIPDCSRVVYAQPGTMTIDGDDKDWPQQSTDDFVLEATGLQDMQCRIRWAWDAQNLYMLVQEMPGDATADEAASHDDYAFGPWNYDGIGLFVDLDNSSDGEQVGEVNVWVGFSSTHQSDLHAARTHEPMELSGAFLPGTQLATSGSQENGDRSIEVAWRWSDWARVVDVQRQPEADLAGAVKPGLRFGCEVLLVDDNWRHQSYIGGKLRPSGRDPNSVDVVLAPKKPNNG